MSSQLEAEDRDPGSLSFVPHQLSLSCVCTVVVDVGSGPAPAMKEQNYLPQSISALHWKRASSMYPHDIQRTLKPANAE